MNIINAFKYRILVAILVPITYLFLIGCGNPDWQVTPNPPYMASPELKAFGEEYFGVKNVDSESGIISEIKIRLDSERMRFYNDLLTEEEMRDLENYTSDDPILIKKIKRYHSFISKIKGKSIFIIPE